MTEIGSAAFGDTKWLEEKRKENPLVIINNIVIDGESCVGDVVIPEGVTSIGDFAFEYSGLMSVTIPEGVMEIGNYAFVGCMALTTITIPESVTNIGGEAFRFTKWLEEKRKENPLVIVNNIVIDGWSCVGDVVIPEEVIEIGSLAFNGCSGLTSITLPESVEEIGNYAFDGCSSFTTIKGKKGSYAEKYANENEFEFVDIGGDVTSPSGDATGPSGDVTGSSGDTSGPSGDTTPSAVFLAGDADCNGTVNLDDAKIVLRLAVGIAPKNPITEQGQKNSDYDKSGKVDLDDAKYTLKTAVGIKFILQKK